MLVSIMYNTNIINQQECSAKTIFIIVFSYRLPIQFLVDPDDSACWVNEELVALITTDYSVQDSSIWFAVNILRDDLQTVTTVLIVPSYPRRSWNVHVAEYWGTVR